MLFPWLVHAVPCLFPSSLEVPILPFPSGLIKTLISSGSYVTSLMPLAPTTYLSHALLHVTLELAVLCSV